MIIRTDNQFRTRDLPALMDGGIYHVRFTPILIPPDPYIFKHVIFIIENSIREEKYSSHIDGMPKRLFGKAVIN